MGGALHIKRRYRALFLVVSKLPQSNNGQKHCRDDCHGVCISDSVVCCEDTCILISTLYGVSIYLNVGVSLSVFSAMT